MRKFGFQLIKLVAIATFLVGASSPAVSQEMDYDWNQSYMETTPAGDLIYQTTPFTFAPGQVIRYIDYEGGKDSNPGTKQAPWKHHPWDPASNVPADANREVDTFVFKGGVVYRGQIEIKGSGEAGNPIRFTTDPSWGSGLGIIGGSETVSGWQAGRHPDMPGNQTVYHVDLDFAPRNVWMLDGQNDITRLHLARTPNWTESDPDDVMSEWWTWDNPQWWKGEGHTATVDDQKMHKGIDKENLIGEADDYVGGYVWTEWGIVMGSPFASKIEAFYPEEKAIAFQGVWYKQTGKIISNNRYYLEDKPNFLDSPGEFWFDKQGQGGRLYVRLPDDMNPENVTIEAAKRINLFDAGKMEHIHISGLHFRFTNVFWDLSARHFVHEDVPAGVVRIQGSGDGIMIDHCIFEHVHMPVRIKVGNDNQDIGEVVIADNIMRHTDHGAIDLSDSAVWGKKEGPVGKVEDLEIIRNDLFHIGWRPIRSEHGHAVSVGRPTMAHVAGNQLQRIAGWGISVTGGKGSGHLWEVPFSRYLVHHNKVIDPLLKSNDWGGIETWQGGTHYVYNNISANPGGLMHWQFRPEKKEGTPRFGHAYYLDGSFKNFLFNNIALGKNNELGSKYANESGLQEIIGFQNTIFNNTFFKFVQAARRQKPDAGRNKYLGNIFQYVSEYVFRHADTKKKDPNAPDAGDQGDEFAYETMAYKNNVLYNISGDIGLFEASGKTYENVLPMREAMQTKQLLAGELATVSPVPALARPPLDMRPADDSQAIDYGVKVFVPWSLYGQVGEWHFYQNKKNPLRVIDEHWYMTEYYTDRQQYMTTPRYPLMGQNIEADDFVDGPLEDWTPGALELDGVDQYLSVKHEELARPFTVGDKTWQGDQKRTVDMQDNNFLIEAYLKTGDDNGTIAGKMDETGYVLEVWNGRLRLRLRHQETDFLGVHTNEPVADGLWHHIVAEVDRENGVKLYIDGASYESNSEGRMTKDDLSNDADFIVGRDLRCTIDFLRVCRGTLEQAHTDIEELHDWQFNGPFLRDFTGRDPADGNRDAGAIELMP
ncbi:MAG: LamG-like jellyroll fold domain-containing protein [Candidatus Sumerlaeota bacterium]